MLMWSLLPSCSSAQLFFGTQVSLGIILMEGVSCSGVAARVGDALQSGKFNSILEDFGATGPSKLTTLFFWAPSPYLLINNSIFIVIN